MKNIMLTAGVVSHVLLLLAGCQTAPGPDDGRVQVHFENPDRYTDVRESAFEQTDRAALESLRAFIIREAHRYLEPGQELSLTFRDIDLAGDFEPWRGPRAQDIRIVKDFYPPRLEFDYTLFDATGTRIAGDHVRLTNMAFLMTAGPGSRSNPLYHEEELLRDWFRRTF